MSFSGVIVLLFPFLVLLPDNEALWRALALRGWRAAICLMKVVGNSAEGNLWEKQVDILGRNSLAVSIKFAGPYSSSGFKDFCSSQYNCQPGGIR